MHRNLLKGAAGVVASLALVALPVAAQEVIKIGFIADRTGNLQAYGIPLLNGSQLAVRKINDAGGVKVGGKSYKLELVVRDSRSDANQASAAAVDLVTDQKVKFVFGAIGTLSPVVMQITDPAKVLYFAASSSAAAQIGKTRYLMLTQPSVNTRVDLSVRGLRQAYPNAKTVALLLPDDAQTAELSSIIQERLKTHGLQLVAFEKYAVGATDFSAQLTRIRSAKADVMYTGWLEPAVASIVRTNREIDAAPNLYSQSVTCTGMQRAGVDRPFASNLNVPADLDNPSTPSEIKLVDEYKKATGDNDPKLLLAMMFYYDFYELLARAIEIAGTVDDTDAIQKAFEKAAVQGVGGPVRIDPSRQAVTGLAFCKVADAKSKVEKFQINP